MTSVGALVDRQMLRRRLLDEAQRHPGEASRPGLLPRLTTLTISRQDGSGGRQLARAVADELGYEFIDRQILDLLVANTGARERLVSSLDEKARSRLEVWLEGMMTGHYLGSVEYSRWLARSIRALAWSGSVVILGRGANIVLGPEGGFHVRVVAPREQRIRNLVAAAGLSADAAERRVDANDRDRAEFHRRQFGADIDDPAAYHLFINTGLVPLDTARDVVIAAWRRINA